MTGASGTAATPQAPGEDLALVRRAATGDTAAFAAIMRRHNRALYRTARSIAHDDAEAEDAVQEAYIRAYRALPQFRADASLRTWLTRIVINQTLARLRRRKREVETTAVDNVIHLEAHLDESHREKLANDTPERAAMRHETRRLLERKIDELPAAFRTVFVLRAVEGLSVEEVAQSLDVPDATVRTRYFRARALLRKSLAADVGLALDDAFAFDGERCDRIVQRVLARIGAPAREG